VGESVRILRELQELSQSQLSELTGIPQATISAIENGRVNLGVERTELLPRWAARLTGADAHPFRRFRLADFAPYPPQFLTPPRVSTADITTWG